MTAIAFNGAAARELLKSAPPNLEEAQSALNDVIGDSHLAGAGAAAARDVSEKLNVRNGGITGVIVMPITEANYGVASADLWNWLRSAAEKPEGRS